MNELAESGTLSLEAARVDIERERLKIEQKRIEAENIERMRNERFFRKHAGEVLAGAVTLAGILVSAANIWVAYIQKEKELQVQQAQKEKDTAILEGTTKAQLAQEEREEKHRSMMSEREYDYKWKLDMLQFVDKHSDQVFSADPEVVSRMRSIMLVSFPAEHVSALFESLQKTARSESQKQVWKEGQELAKGLMAEVQITEQLPDAPPPVSAGQVPYTATHCDRFPRANDLAATQCRIACWDKGQRTHYSVNTTVVADSESACQASALHRCRQAGNSFCAYAWGSPPPPPAASHP